MGDVAEHGAQLVGPIADPAHGHEQRDQAALAHPADDLASAIEQAGDAVAGETVEIVVGDIHALRREQLGERAAGKLVGS